MKFKSTTKSYTGVHGSTIINHKIRVKLGLNCDEYVIADYIYQRKDKVYAKDDFEDLNKKTGYLPGDVMAIGQALISKGILVAGLYKGKLENVDAVRVTELWTAEFNETFDEEFKEFWDVYGHIGNKEEARIVFLKTRKTVEYKHLLKQNQKYDEHLKKNTWKDKMHCSVWLNPDKKRFDDEYGAEKRKEGEEPKLKLTTKW